MQHSMMLPCPAALEADFSDQRLTRRFCLLLTQLSGSTEQSVPKRLVSRSSVKAYYRFINHQEVSSSTMLESYRQASLSAADAYGGMILSIQDTTELLYNGKRSAPHLGLVSHAYLKGMFLHNHMLLTEQGAPLGIFSQTFYTRKAEGYGQRKARRSLPIEEKESYRWVEQYQQLESAFASRTGAKVLCICDREADFHELLQVRQVDHVHYLIRSKANRKQDQNEACIEDSDYIYEQIGKEEVQFSYSLDLPQRQKEPARTAQLSVRYTQVRIHAGYRPKGQTQLTPVDIRLIEVKEDHPPQGVKPLCWRLFTSLPVDSKEQARAIIQFYLIRWVIERFHFVLKQGFEIEKRQIEDPEALKNAIALDSWAAMQICMIHYLAQAQPDIPAVNMDILPQDFLWLVEFLARKYKIHFKHQHQPTIKDLHRLWAIFGGFQQQKNKNPGIVALWRGRSTCQLLLMARDFEKDMGNG